MIVRKGGIASFGASNGTLSVDVTSLGLAAGDTIIVGIVTRSSSSDQAPPSLVGNVSGAIGNDADLFANDTRDTNAFTFSRILTGADTSLTFTGLSSAVYYSYTVVAYAGADPAKDVPVASATGTDSDLPHPPPVTPLTAGAKVVVVCAGVQTAVAAWTAPAGLSNFIQSDSANGQAGRIASGDIDWTTGAVDPGALTGGDAPNSLNNSWGAVTYVLRQLGATPPSTNSGNFFLMF